MMKLKHFLPLRVTATKIDEMVLLTQKWLNQEYGNVSGFGSVTGKRENRLECYLRSYKSAPT